MRKFIVIVGLVCASVSIYSAAKVVEIKSIIASLEQYVGKTITIQGSISIGDLSSPFGGALRQLADRFIF